MGDQTIIGNTLINSPNAQIGNIDDGASRRALKDWLMGTARRARSKTHPSWPIVPTRLSSEIMESTAFLDCTRQKGQTLLLTGKMGAGKTSTMSVLLDRLTQYHSVATASMYFEFDFPLEHDSSRVLMRFFGQLADLNDRDHFHLAYSLYSRYPSEAPTSKAIVDTLVATMKHIASKPKQSRRPTCILVDGLDELGLEDDHLADLKTLIEHLATIQSQTGCGLVLSARYDTFDFSSIFEQWNSVEIVAKVDGAEELVKSFLPFSMARSLARERPAIEEETVEAVTAGSGGLFLLMKLNTAYILSARTDAVYAKALAEVKYLSSPSTMTSNTASPERTIFPNAFGESLKRLEIYSKSMEPDAHDALTVLALMRDAVRPLRATELLYLLALHGNSEEFGSEALLRPDHLSKMTQGLMDVGHSGMAYFVHPWLKSYLQRSRWKETFPDSNAALAKSCVRYLSWNEFSRGSCATKEDLDKRMHGSPLLDYAARYWVKHYSAAIKEHRDPALLQHVLSFLRRRGSASCARQVLLLPEPVLEYRKRKYVESLSQDQAQERFSVLANLSFETKQSAHVDLYHTGGTTGSHLVTLLDQIELVKVLLEERPRVINETDDNDETLLHLALAYSSDDLISYLISKGADLNRWDHEGLTPWHIAALYNRENAVGVMLEQRVSLLEVNAPIRPSNPRRKDSRNVPHGPDAHNVLTWTYQSFSGSTATHLAARQDNTGVVSQIIKDPRFRHDTEDDDGMTAFHKACKYGHVGIVRLFIESHPQCAQHASSKDGRIGLHLACKYEAGYGVAELLLDSFPGTFEVKDNNAESAIHHAAAGQSTRTVALLLRYGIHNLNARNTRNETPLVLAARARNHATFDLLDGQPGVDRDVEDGTRSLQRNEQLPSGGLMSSTGNPRNTWLGIISSQQGLLTNKFGGTPASDEIGFRGYFTEVCKTQKEHRYLTLLNKVLIQHHPILNLTKAVDQTVCTGSPLTASALIWGILHLVTKTAFETKHKLSDLALETDKLNRLVPRLNREQLCTCNNNQKVQEPLQGLLHLYMEAYFAILSENSPGLSLVRFGESIGAKQEYFKRHGDDWDHAFQNARQEEQSRLAASAPGIATSRPFINFTQTRFVPIKRLGMGSFGHVHEVEQEVTKERFAQKLISVERSNVTLLKLREQVSKEISAMQKLRHHHIVTLAFHMEDEEGFKLMMQPVADCNLGDFLLGCIEERFPRSRVWMLDNWFGCLVTALSFAHNNQVIHEDLKLSNILIKDDRIYLADFGCARDFENAQSSVSAEEIGRGTVDYWPPEKVHARGRAADIFALGCVFSEILTVRHRRTLDEYKKHRKSDAREYPYAFNKNLAAVKSWVREELMLGQIGDLRLTDGTPADSPDQRAMAASAEDREAVTELLFDVTLMMVEEDPAKRGDARKIKRMLRQGDHMLFCGNCL
ncbi:hypothetical protein Q7P37_002301 [Cladosporium fusiforme]